MALLRPPAVNTREFTWVEKERLLVTEMSDLNARGITFGRVFDDACDEGLSIISQRTGIEVVFAVNHIEKSEGDLVFWDLVPWGASGPLDLGIRVRVFND